MTLLLSGIRVMIHCQDGVLLVQSLVTQEMTPTWLRAWLSSSLMLRLWHIIGWGAPYLMKGCVKPILFENKGVSYSQMWLMHDSYMTQCMTHPLIMGYDWLIRATTHHPFSLWLTTLFQHDSVHDSILCNELWLVKLISDSLPFFLMTHYPISLWFIPSLLIDRSSCIYDIKGSHPAHLSSANSSSSITYFVWLAKLA